MGAGNVVMVPAISEDSPHGFFSELGASVTLADRLHSMNAVVRDVFDASSPAKIARNVVGLDAISVQRLLAGARLAIEGAAHKAMNVVRRPRSAYTELEREIPGTVLVLAQNSAGAGSYCARAIANISGY